MASRTTHWAPPAPQPATSAEMRQLHKNATALLQLGAKAEFLPACVHAIQTVYDAPQLDDVDPKLGTFVAVVKELYEGKSHDDLQTAAGMAYRLTESVVAGDAKDQMIFDDLWARTKDLRPHFTSWRALAVAMGVPDVEEEGDYYGREELLNVFIFEVPTFLADPEIRCSVRGSAFLGCQGGR